MTGTPITKTHRVKLAKLLALSESPFAGERDAAVLAAHRLVKSLGVTWSQVMLPTPLEKRLPERGVWRITVARCLERPGSLRPWETKFLRDLTGFQRLSTKQRYVLAEIADRVLQRAAS